MQREWRKRLVPFYYLLPALIGILFIYAYPIISSVYNSFMDYNVSRSPDATYNGIANYLKLFSDPMFPKIIKNTLIYVVLSVFIQFLLGFLLAMLLVKRFPGKSVYQSIVFIPWAVAGFLIAIMFKWMFNAQWGVINDLLMKLGILDQAYPFLSSPDTSLYTAVVASVWYGLPFFAIMILASLQSIPADLYEAADLDGAHKLRQFWSITVPYIKPTLILTVLLRIIWMFNSGDLIYIMTAGGPANSSHILPTYLFEKAFISLDFGLASAVAAITVAFLIVFTVTYLLITKFEKSGDF
ncbi:carbohydrate ABC transporter permease [Cohnella boryungensis]|uniref:Carbohydrate ABC transporter permease n=1 Tax=Cohnella boryungensis TaxID=768479 RepID=A0ABV8SHU2_9BACL